MAEVVEVLWEVLAKLPPASREVEVRLECSLSLNRMRRHLMLLWQVLSRFAFLMLEFY